MSIDDEFVTIDLILSSNAATRAVDAFALAIIKVERQMRKLFTHLIYQFPCFGPSDIPALRNTLAANRNVYFDDLIAAFDSLSPRSVDVLIGSDHQRLRSRIDEAIAHRNKIFHGQLTPRELSRAELMAYVDDVRAWCVALATGAVIAIAYDGFGRNSFQKSSIIDLSRRYRQQLASVADYADLLSQTVAKRRKGRMP